MVPGEHLFIFQTSNPNTLCTEKCIQDFTLMHEERSLFLRVSCGILITGNRNINLCVLITKTCKEGIQYSRQEHISISTYEVYIRSMTQSSALKQSSQRTSLLHRSRNLWPPPSFLTFAWILNTKRSHQLFLSQGMAYMNIHHDQQSVSVNL